MNGQSRRQLLQGGLSLFGVSVVSGCGLGLPWVSRPPRDYRVGYVTAATQLDVSDEAFRDGLRDLGYVEGENLRLEVRFGAGSPERARALVAELVNPPVDAIVARGVEAIRASMQATGTIPIVFPISTDPVGLGFVASVSRPGGNVTGLTAVGEASIQPKRLEMLKETLPWLARVGVLWHDDDRADDAGYRGIQEAAQRLSVQLYTPALRTPEELERAFQAADDQKLDAMIVVGGTQTVANQARMIDLAAVRRVPVMYGTSEAVRMGGLMAYSGNFTARFRRAAMYVDKILKGARPADLPVELETSFDFVINLKTAQALGLTIPQSVLQQATEVIQ